MKIRRPIFLFFLAFASAPALLQAQTQVPEGYELVDSLVYRRVDSYDVSLEGVSPLAYARSGRSKVQINQSQAIGSGLSAHISERKGRTMNGYRVRIYFDNKQNSRGASEAALRLFLSRYPGHGAYRSFVNPFFKVTVGDFRTRSEAMALLEQVKRDFPSSFVVREAIEFPVADAGHSYVIDTVKVLRPAVPTQQN